MSSPNLIFKTKSGSSYEVDRKTEEIRRLASGSSGPSNRVTEEWKPYTFLGKIRVGYSVAIFWPDGVPLLGGSPVGCLPMTVTSPVVEITELDPWRLPASENTETK